MDSGERISSKELKEKRRWAIISLASIPLIMTLGNSMLIPILPMLEKELDITKFQSSLIITVYSVVAIFLIPIAGYLSDRFGRKPVIIPSLIITGIGGLIAGLASWKMENPYIVILIGRILQGVGASGAMPIVLPMVGDIFQKDEDASATLGIIETSNTIGKVLSPILGSLLAGIIWFLPFLSIPAFCLVSAIMVAFLIKKTDTHQEEDKPNFKMFLRMTKKAFKKHMRWLIAVFIIGAILMFILFGFLFYLSSVLEDKYHYDGIWKGFLLAIPLIALSLAAYITGKVIKNHLKLMKWITFIGIILSSCSLIFIPFMEEMLFLLIVFLICGVGIGAALPCLDSLITKSIEKDIRGTITSFYSAMRFIGVAAGPPIIAILMKYNIMWMVALLTACALIASFLAYRNINPE